MEIRIRFSLKQSRKIQEAFVFWTRLVITKLWEKGTDISSWKCCGVKRFMAF